jgi:Type I phosphodiesterase / nucleotide pyrophosphatase
LLAASAGLPGLAEADGGFGGDGIKHVLLISIDGMHALDFINCAQGISGVNGGAPYCPNLAELAETGVNYLDTSTSKPSDSFPGLMALVSGGSPRTVGAFYDVAYDRSLDPPATTTATALPERRTFARQARLRPARPPNSTRESISTRPNRTAERQTVRTAESHRSIRTSSSATQRISALRSIRGILFAPTRFFGVVHAAGGYTAWSDKHPYYSSVSGPGPGFATNVDDYYSPEINSIPV